MNDKENKTIDRCVEQGIRHYLAYGSNLNLAQMKKRCPRARKVGVAVLEGYRLFFKGENHNCHLTIEPEEGYHVPVGVFAVTPSDEQALDGYEGFPFYYRKQLFRVKLEDGREIDAFAYVMKEGWEIGMPSSSYVLTVKKGYEDFGFDRTILNEVLVHANREVNGNLIWATRIVDGHIVCTPHYSKSLRVK